MSITRLERRRYTMVSKIREKLNGTYGWLMRSLITIVFLGLIGWVSYNTYAADNTQEKLSIVCQKVEKHDGEIPILKNMAKEGTNQRNTIMLQLIAISEQLSAIKEVQDLIKDGRLIPQVERN